jgi:plastocyanin
VLASVFGDNDRIEVTSSLLPGVVRTFDSYSAAATETGLSRIYAGVHTRIDHQAGVQLGHAVAGFVLDAAGSPAFGLRIGAGTLRPAAAHSLASSRMAMAPMDMAAMVVARSPQSTAVRLHQRVVHLTIQNLAFQPARVVVSQGTRIVWTNIDGFAHTVTSDKGLWSSPDVNSHSQFARVFSNAGTFPYHCTIHPFMHGVVIVKR